MDQKKVEYEKVFYGFSIVSTPLSLSFNEKALYQFNVYKVPNLNFSLTFSQIDKEIERQSFHKHTHTN